MTHEPDHDVLARLAALDHGGPPPTRSVLDADLHRGRRALRGRRIRITGAAAVVALAAGGTTIGLTSGSDGHATHMAQTPPTVSATTAPSHAAVSHTPVSHPPARPPAIKLVAYTGEQRAGYRITWIPEGFGLGLQASTSYSLVLARHGDTSSPDSFVDKIVITAEDASAGGVPTGRTVTVHGAPATLADDGTAAQIWFRARGLVVNVQAWDTIGLTHEQLVQFADGVTVTSQVQVVHG